MTESEKDTPSTATQRIYSLPRTLRWRVTLSTFLCLALSILGYGSFMAKQQTDMKRLDRAEEITALTQNLAAISTFFLVTADLAGLESALSNFATVSGIQSLLITDGSGKPLCELVNKNQRWHPIFNNQIIVLPLSGGPTLESAQHADAGDLYVAWHPIEAGAALGWARITFLQQSFAETFYLIGMQSLWALALAGLLSTLLLQARLRSSLQALQIASRFAQELDQKLGQQLVPYTRVAELEVLGRALNKSSRNLLAQHIELNNQQFALDQHAIVAITDVQGRITYVNDRFCEISGYTAAELHGQNHRLLQSGVHPVEFFRQMFRAIGSGQVWHGEVCNRAKQGHLYWVQTTITPFMGLKGKPVKYVAIRTDITALRAAEQELIVHRDNLYEIVRLRTLEMDDSKAIAKNALQALDRQRFVIDAHAIVTVCGVNGRITYGNDKFSQISGYTREEFLGQDHGIVHSGYHPKGFFKQMYQTILRGEIWHGEVCNRASDGHLYWVDTTIAAFMDALGRPVEYISVRTDITNRIRAENEAQAASLAKSNFLANMSHEIRTPMNGVIGMIDILQQTELSPAQSRMLVTINNSALSLLRILNDILDYSKIEAGRLDVECIAMNLREMTEDVIRLMINIACGKEAEISLFVDPSLPVWILSDPSRLRQVLFNLLGNALKFIAPETGRAMLHVYPVIRPDGVSCVQFRVSDNGIGMSAEVVQKLFKPFSQADETTARKFGGTGLGLSISLQLVQLMQGRISVSSTHGAGSLFCVEIPLQDTAAPAGRTPAIEPDLSGVEVLAVTASTEYATLLEVYLHAAGAKIAVVTDLQTARRHLHQAHQKQTSGNTLPVKLILLLDLAEENSDHEVETEGISPNSSDWLNEVTVIYLVRHGDKSAESGDIEVHTRPLFYQDLIQGVAMASGRAPIVNGAAKPSLQSKRVAPGIEQARAAGQLILLAEDNETNRLIMQEQLRLLGYVAQTARDGVEALQMWASGSYALLLTDCHMPNMDGFELTAAIRQAEAKGAHLPIIAVTANAMQGEAQRCLERGMDDYLSKPLRLEKLGAMLARWLPLPQVTAVAVVADALNIRELAKAPALWDPTVLTRMVGNNPPLHCLLLEKFLENATELVARIASAVVTQDQAAVGFAAHALKSAAQTVGAQQLGQLCQALELAGKAGDATLCSQLAGELSGIFTEAAEHIDKHLAMLALVSTRSEA